MERNKRVLIVDDKQDLLKVIEDLLELFGYDVCVAKDGYEALDIMKEKQVSAVVSDIYMPEMDGFCLMTEIKDRFPGTPVILMTGLGAEDARKLALSKGADGFIAKPFRIKELTDILDALL
ncbi:MAG: response regulator [Deltaproteobacteria bacterium]|nr:response regulator [Deltaproteobacteria bacterium]